jgi:hypothetical protein
MLENNHTRGTSPLTALKRIGTELPQPSLSDKEKVIAMRSIFQSSNNNSTKYVKNVSDFISGNFDKIDGFDFRWHSLITNNPLLFEDINYLRVKPFVDNIVTEDERQAYINGGLREIYATFDNMLMCNLRHYNRIMSFCTMVFMHYVTIGEDNVNKGLDKMPWELQMTPTKIWCCALSGPQSTGWEIGYGWNNKIIQTLKPNQYKSIFEIAWPMLYKNATFAKFVEYSSLRCDTIGFRATRVSDVTPNRKLAQICAKFTKTSVAISEEQLETIYEYSREIEGIKSKLYVALENCLLQMFHGERSQFSIYIFNKEYYIYTSKFTLRVSCEKGVITKDYLANSYECFIAEEFLVQSIRTQIEWSRYQIPQQHSFDRNVLKSLMTRMLDENYRETMCLKRMNDYGTVTKVTFKGNFANVRIIEDFMLDNRVIRTVTKVLSKKNAANWLIERGYYIFGTEADIFKLETISRQSLISHYSNYCVPVMSHMFDVIAAHEVSKNDIAEVIAKGYLNPARLNNENGMRYTNVMTTDSKQIFSTGMDRQNSHNLGKKKSYWTAIEG